MLFGFNRYSALLLIFFVHGLVYAFLLAQRSVREGRRADGWLAAFLVLCVLHITPWMVGFAGWYGTQPYRDLLFYVPFQHLFALGPVVFFYTQSLLNPSWRFTRRSALHLVPAALYLVYTTVVFAVDKMVVHRYLLMDGQSDPDFDTWYQALGFVSMLAYTLLSLRYYRLYRRLMLQVTSFAEHIRFPWVRPFLLSFSGMLLLRALFFVLSLLGYDDYSDSWWYFFGFALLYYYIAIRGYGNTQRPPVAYKPLLAEQKAVLLLPAPGAAGGEFYVAEEEAIVVDAEPALSTSGAADPELTAWIEKVESMMHDKVPWKDAELNLTALALRLGMPGAQLSRIINKGFGCNFNDFVNGYRVRAVQEAIRAGEHRRQTLLGIAYDCGFNSKATFNRAFVRQTGKNPSAFAKEG